MFRRVGVLAKTIAAVVVLCIACLALPATASASVGWSTPSATPTSTCTPSPSPSPTCTPSPTPSPTPTVTPTPTPTVTPTVTPTPTTHPTTHPTKHATVPPKQLLHTGGREWMTLVLGSTLLALGVALRRQRGAIAAVAAVGMPRPVITLAPFLETTPVDLPKPVITLARFLETTRRS
jgi:hypothetical protein